VFTGIDGGVARLAEELTTRLTDDGVTIHLGAEVIGLHQVTGGWRLTMNNPLPAPDDRDKLDVDAVVLALPAPAAASLLAIAGRRPGLGASGPAIAELARLTAGIETADVAVVACAVPTAITGNVAGSGVLVPPSERRAVKAITLASSKWAWIRRRNPDVDVLRLSLGRHRDGRVLELDDDELTAVAVRDASAILGVDLRPATTRVVRWTESLPQYAVGHRARVQRMGSLLSDVPGLAICGSMIDGVGVPACIAAAGAAANSIRAQWTMTP
jgi:oxygen-dependent protoporphyrinogen oxidase